MPETIASAVAALGPPLLILPSALILLVVGAAASTAGAWRRATRAVAAEDAPPYAPRPCAEHGGAALR